MTKRNKLYAALLIEELRHRQSLEEPYAAQAYLAFLSTQAHKNNVYAMALRQIEG